jgi:hypothetical protein
MIHFETKRGIDWPDDLESGHRFHGHSDDEFFCCTLSTGTYLVIFLNSFFSIAPFPTRAPYLSVQRSQIAEV